MVHQGTGEIEIISISPVPWCTIYYHQKTFVISIWSGVLRNGPLEKLWGGWGIFEPDELFFLKNFPCINFLGLCMNIF